MAPRRKKSKTPSDNLHDRLAALREDLAALQGDVKGLAGDAGDVATDKMNTAINDAMESVQDMADRVEEWGDDHLGSLKSSVREQPLAACALAMGLGAFLGAIFLRR